MKRIPVGPIIFMMIMCVVALFFGLAVSVLPLKLTLIGTMFILLIVGGVVVLLMPEQAAAAQRAMLMVMFIAFAAKFLWPNFAYIPIDALPTKNPQRLVWAMALAYWIYTLATNRELRHRLASRIIQSRVVWLVLALFVLRAVSIAFSAYPVVSTYTVLIEVFDYLPALLFALTWIRGEEDVRAFGRAIVVTTLAVSAITLAEVLMKQNVFTRLVPTDVSNEEFLVMALEEKLRGGVYRAQASFNHPLLLAQFIVTVLPILLLTCKLERGSYRALAALAIAMVPLGLVASRTRTSIIVAGFVLAAVFLIAAVNRARMSSPDSGKQIRGALSVLGGIAAAGVLVAVGYILTVGRTAEEASSSGARVEMLYRAADAAQDSPLFGFGPGLGAPKAAVYSSRGTGSLDNYWLILLLDSGLPAMLLFLGLLGFGVKHMLRYLFTGHRDPTKLVSGMWGTAVVAFGLTTTILGTPHNLPLLYFALGALVALQFPAASTAAASASLHKPPARAFVAWRP